jgi:hypothetical protein
VVVVAVLVQLEEMLTVQMAGMADRVRRLVSPEHLQLTQVAAAERVIHEGQEQAGPEEVVEGVTVATTEAQRRVRQIPEVVLAVMDTLVEAAPTAGLGL